MDSVSNRKDSHLALCLSESIDFYTSATNEFSSYRFDHDALPELDFSKISLQTELFGKTVSSPIVIGAMTGGTPRAGEINRRLALAAEACGIGLALGSQRKMLGEHPDPSVVKSYQVREYAPRLPLLFGNLGAVQLNYGVSSTDIQQLVERTGCDVLNFHLNPLQEAIQPEGDTDFSGLLSKLHRCIPEIKVPVVIKEVGAGISLTTARKLKALPIRGIETAGAGGTSWSKIESLRAAGTIKELVGNLFARWGIPTVESLLTCRAELPHLTVIASGGIRNGLEIAKAIALGADACALALPFLKSAEVSVEKVIETIQRLETELKTALFITGIGSLAELKRTGREHLRRTTDHCGATP